MIDALISGKLIKTPATLLRKSIAETRENIESVLYGL